jgi:uncharacterized integral membrane protein
VNRFSTIMGIVIGAAVSVYVVLFGIANGDIMRVDLLFAETDFPMYVVVAIAFLGGAGLVGALAAVSSLKRHAERRRLNKRIAVLEDEVGRLRNAPITGAEDATTSERPANV